MSCSRQNCGLTELLLTTSDQATVRITSTLRVGSSGEPSSSSSSSGKSLGLGLGLGLGIPVALVALGMAIWFCIRAVRRDENAGTEPTYHDVPPMGQDPPSTQYSSEFEYTQAAAAAATKPITRKSVPAVTGMSQTPSSPPGRQELTGQPIRRELGGMELHPFPNYAPSSPVTVPGQHELGGQGRIQELCPGQASSPPPPVYQQHGQYPHYAELGDQQR